MPSARVILFERGDEWRRALRTCEPEFGLAQSSTGQTSKVLETRSLQECRSEVDKYPASVLGLEFASRDAAGVVDLLVHLRHFAPLSRAVLLIPPDTQLPVAEWELRQVGAVHLIHQRRRMAEFAHIARTHLEWIRQLSGSDGIAAAKFQ